MPKALPEEVEALSITGLADADWRVRVQAAQNLADVRTRASVEALIEASGDPRPVVARSVRDALTRLTKQGWSKPEQWKRWWEGQHDGFDLEHPPERPETDPEERSVAVRYNDLPVESDHVAFLIDVSAGMRERLTSQATTQAEAAHGELERALELLDARTAKKALAFVNDANPRGKKDIWNAILTALEDGELDTLYLLASGEPEIGLYVHHNRIVEHLRELTRFHKIVVHGVAYTDSDWYAEQLEEVCQATGGEFRRVK